MHIKALLLTTTLLFFILGCEDTSQKEYSTQVEQQKSQKKALH